MDRDEMLARLNHILEQAQDCINGVTPEDISDEEAREDTISKIREGIFEIIPTLQSYSQAESKPVPVAWQKRPTFGDVRVWTSTAGNAENHDFWREQDYEIRPLYAAQPANSGQHLLQAADDLHDVAFKAGWDAALANSGQRSPPMNETDPAHLTAELLRLKNRFDRIFNNVLVDMKPGWDDSVEGFNKAWDIARDIFQEEIGRATAAALSREEQANG